ncbi:hypothetical protein LTR85_004288 [Meristemomyces frigidus]|nr:hypothetical protein LTR85_004288 [Meristemomyces frigidus]
MPDEIKSKEGQPISEGDHVYTKYRGGKHEGEVEAIVSTKDEAAEEGVKNPPKVVFTDQNDKRVSHNPGTLTNTEGE